MPSTASPSAASSRKPSRSTAATSRRRSPARRVQANSTRAARSANGTIASVSARLQVSTSGADTAARLNRPAPPSMLPSSATMTSSCYSLERRGHELRQYARCRATDPICPGKRETSGENLENRCGPHQRRQRRRTERRSSPHVAETDRGGNPGVGDHAARDDEPVGPPGIPPEDLHKKFGAAAIPVVAA